MKVHQSTDEDLDKLETTLLEARMLAEQIYFNYQMRKRDSGEYEPGKIEMLETCLGYVREALTCLKPANQFNKKRER